MQRYLVDPKSYELAEYFLDNKIYSDMQRFTLAKAIQEAVDGWFVVEGK